MSALLLIVLVLTSAEVMNSSLWVFLGDFLVLLPNGLSRIPVYMGMDIIMYNMYPKLVAKGI